jgi:putative transposase
VQISSKTEAHSQKKTVRSSQAGTEITQKKRLDYWESIRDVLADDLVFVDEMGVLLGLMRGMGRSKKGDRVYDVKPFYRGSRVTVVGAISNKSILALKTLGQSMNGEDFKKFVEEELLPKLWKGAVVVMDNLKAHKMKGIIEMIESVGARVVYLSPYSPEFNPIEHLWWQLKALIRKFSPKNSLTVVQLLSVGVLLCSSQQLQNYFSHCCYCTS